MTIVTVFVGALLAQIVGRAAVELFMSWKYRLASTQDLAVAPFPREELVRMRDRHQAQLELHRAALDAAAATGGDGDAREVVALVAAAAKFADLAAPTERASIELDLQRMAAHPNMAPLTGGCAPGSHDMPVAG